MCFVLGPLEQHGYRHELVNRIVDDYGAIVDLLREGSSSVAVVTFLLLVSSTVPVSCCTIQINILQWNCPLKKVVHVFLAVFHAGS